MSSDKIIVLVLDKGDSKHGEVSVLDDAQKAERLVETLLEAGFEEDRIRVFTGRPSEFQISHRPVVAFVGEGEDGEARPAAGEPRPVTDVENRGAEAEEPAVAPQAAAPAVAAQESADGDKAQHADGETGQEEGEPATAEAEEPVRFSTLFRSA